MVAALTTVAWWFRQFPYIVRRMPHPKLGPTCEFRLCHTFTASRRRPAPTFTSACRPYFLLLLTLHKLYIMQQIFLIIILLSLVCTIFCAQENDPGWAVSSTRRTNIPRHLGWTGGFVSTSLPHAGDFGITLPVCIDRAMSPLRRVKLSSPPPRDRLGGWNLVPHQARTASSIPNTLAS